MRGEMLAVTVRNDSEKEYRIAERTGGSSEDPPRPQWKGDMFV